MSKCEADPETRKELERLSGENDVRAYKNAMKRSEAMGKSFDDYFKKYADRILGAKESEESNRIMEQLLKVNDQINEDIRKAKQSLNEIGIDPNSIDSEDSAETRPAHPCGFEQN
jgi:hypothetical protein